MGRTTKEINKITGLIISTSIKLIFISLVVLILYEGAAKGYAFGYEVFYPSTVAGAPGTDREVTISAKQSVSEVARMLEDTGLIKNSYVFMIQTRLYEYEINPGTYQLNTSMTSMDILNEIKEQYAASWADSEQTQQSERQQIPESDGEGVTEVQQNEDEQP